ncbi:MAG: glycosyltransferase family 4 protein [Xanthomonadales bacterium]|nr:glycosyltransferase family 4 protein [Xanthomonadales bacterium]
MRLADQAPDADIVRRLLMVSTSYPAGPSDWRGLFIRHLTHALARRRDLALRNWNPPGELPDNVADAATPAESAWLARLMAAGGIAHLVRAGGLRGLWQPLRLLGHLRALYRRETGLDLRHVNWLQNALVLPGDRVPLLTTVLGTDMQLLRLPGMTWLLRRVFRRRATAICPNAEWMVPELERRFGDVARVRFVPFGIDPCWFAVQRAPAAPARWVCVSRITHGKIGTLFDWAAPHFADGRRELHLYGPMQQDMRLPPWVIHHGPATPEQLCAQVFPAAQGLITLSQHAEGRPQVMLEAMAAGLPIIASGIAAHRDLLRHGETGWLCERAEALAPALEALEQRERNHAIGVAAQEWVKAQIGTWDDCAARYVALYRELLARDRP